MSQNEERSNKYKECVKLAKDFCIQQNHNLGGHLFLKKKVFRPQKNEWMNEYVKRV